MVTSSRPLASAASILLLALFCLIFSMEASPAGAQPSTKVTTALERLLRSPQPTRRVRAWVYFADKGQDLTARLAALEKTLTPENTKRRLRNRPQDHLVDELDLPVAGADELDSELTLIKGGGGALLREKIVAYHSKRMVVIADRSKAVECLGAFPLPIEVTPFWWQATQRSVAALDVMPRLRYHRGAPFRTDNGNFILDCPFGSISEPKKLAVKLLAIPGVVEIGLFLGLATQAYLGDEEEVRRIYPSKADR